MLAKRSFTEQRLALSRPWPPDAPKEEPKKLEIKDFGDLCAFVSLFFFVLAFALGVVGSVLEHYHLVQFYGLFRVAFGFFVLFALAAVTGSFYRFLNPRERA